MCIGHWDQGGTWDPTSIEGITRFLQRAWAVVTDAAHNPPAGEPSADDVRMLERKLHQTIIKVTDDIGAFRFNTAIAALMELNNMLMKYKETTLPKAPIWDEAVDSLLLLMAPIFPHISEELWHLRGHEASVHVQQWPQGSATKAQEAMVEIVVQINGKIRERLQVAPGTSAAALEAEALANANVLKWMGGKPARKVIAVPDKLVNVVV